MTAEKGNVIARREAPRQSTVDRHAPAGLAMTVRIDRHALPGSG